MPVDEMRLGLKGVMRRVWCSRGVKVVQRLQFVFEWIYLVVAADPCSGKLRWQWISRLNQAQLLPVIQHWGLDGLIWDNASAHTGKQMAAVDTTLIFQPPYSPELNPIERLFEYLRDKIEGRNYPSLQAKMAAVDHELRRLAARPKAVRQLIGYDWMQAALDALPEPDFTSPA